MRIYLGGGRKAEKILAGVVVLIMCLGIIAEITDPKNYGLISSSILSVILLIIGVYIGIDFKQDKELVDKLMKEQEI